MIQQTGKIMPSARGIIIRNGKFLILKRAKNDSFQANCWEFPGGKIDFGQDINEALKREIREETGLDVYVKEPLFFWDEKPVSAKYEDKIIVTLYFSCETPLNGKVVLSDEHDEYRWAEYLEIQSLQSEMAHHTKEVLERLGKSEY